MFAAIALTVGLAANLAPAVPPAPLPDRWLLKLIPDGLPSLPDRFYAVTWYDRDPRYARWGDAISGWEVWADFRKPGPRRPAEAFLTETGQRPWPSNQIGTGFPLAGWGHRTARLAVHGPLVEFEGRLFTATIRTRKDALDPQADREVLHLGSAIELKDRVWYQAGTVTPLSGGAVSVEEWRIEFRDDPRTADRGTAMLRGHWRVLTEPEGESFAAEVSFQAGKTYEGGRTVRLLWPTGMRQTRLLPRLEITDSRGRMGNVMWVDGMHLLSLYPAPKPRPRLPEPLPPGLVQPPAKKPGK